MSSTVIPESVLIAGGGLAGFSVAQELRKRGYEGEITLVDPEGLPYDRPPLSKEYLDGSVAADNLPFVAESWFEENAVEVVVDHVTGITPDTGVVTGAGGELWTADAIVLATGGRARTLPVPGGDLPGVIQLRTKEDADHLRTFLAPGKRLAIIGGGLIGAEVASTAVKAGATVTLIEPAGVPAAIVMGQTIALYLHGLHEAHGVNVIAKPTSAIRREGDEWIVVIDGGPQEGGSEVKADAVLVAIGIVPNVSLALDAGLDVDNGILVDQSQRTSHERVYAVGDIARHRAPDGSLLHRHEHWQSAMQSGQTAAAAMLGQELPVHPAPWMWSDRYDHHVEAVGSMARGHLVVRERDGKPWVSFLLDDDGRLLGAAAIDGGIAIRAAQRMIDRGTVVDPAQLADPAVNLKKLAR
ncbi:MAG TPA: FAD-dependent oxidoreductase [Propionibacterium sp.]|nr:FAD-dependent oxidoreductase [Propionibacterium sp.]